MSNIARVSMKEENGGRRLRRRSTRAIIFSSFYEIEMEFHAIFGWHKVLFEQKTEDIGRSDAGSRVRGRIGMKDHGVSEYANDVPYRVDENADDEQVADQQR